MGAGASAKKQADESISSRLTVAADVDRPSLHSSVEVCMHKSTPETPRGSCANSLGLSATMERASTIPQSPRKPSAPVYMGAEEVVTKKSGRAEGGEGAGNSTQEVDRYSGLYRQQSQSGEDSSFVGGTIADPSNSADYLDDRRVGSCDRERMMQMYHAAMLAEGGFQRFDINYEDRSVYQGPTEPKGEGDAEPDGLYGAYEQEDECNDEDEDYYAQRYRYGRSAGDLDDDDEDVDAEEDPDNAVDDEHLQSLALSAMSLGMDNEELLFNLYFFGQQGTSEDQGANVRSSVNTAIEEAVAAHSANNTPYKLRPVAKDLIDSYISSKFIPSDIDPAEECLICQEALLCSPCGRRGGRCSPHAHTAACNVSHTAAVSSDQDREVVFLVICRHFFHRGCITKWFSLQNWCPICRSTICAEPGRASGISIDKHVPISILDRNEVGMCGAADDGYESQSCSRRPSTDSVPGPSMREI